MYQYELKITTQPENVEEHVKKTENQSMQYLT